MLCIGVMHCEGELPYIHFRYEELSDGDVAFKMVNENASMVHICCVVQVVKGHERGCENGCSHCLVPPPSLPLFPSLPLPFLLFPDLDSGALG